ncbi:hypothetical protein [Stieleria neptunia]|nr:hypothetical protein [Stieleria neptunia]
MLKCFRIDTPFPLRIPFPRRGVPDSNLLPPTSLAFDPDDDRGVVRMMFAPPTKWVEWSRKDVPGEFLWMPHVRTKVDAFQWWKEGWIHIVERRETGMKTRLDRRLADASDDGERERIRSTYQHWFSEQENISRRPAEWTIEHWTAPSGSGMRSWRCGDGIAVTFESQVLGFVPGSPVLLLISPDSGAIYVPNGGLDFLHSAFSIGNPHDLYSPSLADKPLDVTDVVWEREEATTEPRDDTERRWSPV